MFARDWEWFRRFFKIGVGHRGFVRFSPSTHDSTTCNKHQLVRRSTRAGLTPRRTSHSENRNKHNRNILQPLRRAHLATQSSVPRQGRARAPPPLHMLALSMSAACGDDSFQVLLVNPLGLHHCPEARREDLVTWRYTVTCWMRRGSDHGTYFLWDPSRCQFLSGIVKLTSLAR